MSRCFLGPCGVLSVALLAVAGCTTRTLATDDGGDDGADDGIDDGGGWSSSGGGGGDDGWKMDVGEPGDGQEPLPPLPNPYPNCFEEDCPSGGGWGMASECGEACMCSVPCDGDAECPLPWSGDAKPVCEYECMLPCDEHTVCPDGMHCYPEIWQCMWGTYDPDDCPGSDELCEDYCQMENLCLVMCGCDDGWCECSSEQRYDECRRDCPWWLFEGDEPPTIECGGASHLWMECIVSLTCGQAVDFFMRYPDDFAPDDPCVPELTEARAACPNFELLTEYGF